MAGVTHTWTSSIRVPGLPTLPADAPVVITGDYAVEVEIDVAAGAADIPVAIGTVDKDKIVSMVLNASVAMDVYTNSVGGSPGQYFPLGAKKSVGWNNTMDSNLFPLPITDSITEFYLNNSGAAAGVFRASFLMQV
jgi:hypothetical protein